MTNLDIQQAREWADNRRRTNRYPSDRERAAIRVVESLPDQWIDAEKVREVIEEYDSWESGALIDDLRALLAPPLPTLADLIDRGNDPQQYQWMQAEAVATDNRFGSHGVITAVNPQWLAPRRCMFLAPDGFSMELPWDEVIPAVDEPKLEFPSLSLSGESEDVSLETETNTEESDGPLFPASAGEVWRAVLNDRAGDLVIGPAGSNGSPKGFFVADGPGTRLPGREVGPAEVCLTKKVWPPAQSRVFDDGGPFPPSRLKVGNF